MKKRRGLKRTFAYGDINKYCPERHLKRQKRQMREQEQERLIQEQEIQKRQMREQEQKIQEIQERLIKEIQKIQEIQERQEQKRQDIIDLDVIKVPEQIDLSNIDPGLSFSFENYTQLQKILAIKEIPSSFTNIELPSKIKRFNNSFKITNNKHTIKKINNNYQIIKMSKNMLGDVSTLKTLILDSFQLLTTNLMIMSGFTQKNITVVEMNPIIYLYQTKTKPLEVVLVHSKLIQYTPLTKLDVIYLDFMCCFKTAENCICKYLKLLNNRAVFACSLCTRGITGNSDSIKKNTSKFVESLLTKNNYDVLDCNIERYKNMVFMCYYITKTY